MLNLKHSFDCYAKIIFVGKELVEFFFTNVESNWDVKIIKPLLFINLFIYLFII